MNGLRQNDPLLVRLARRLLAMALTHWPEETRAWGRAVAAELDEAADPLESLWWSLGGMVLFLRSLAASVWTWLHLPVGIPLSRGGEHAALLPRRSRLFTAAMLLAAAAVLFLPQGREALNTFRSSWSGFMPTRFDLWQLDRLGRRAEKQSDATILAFVALSTEDPERCLEFADRAVSIDPQYVWIYAAVRTRYSRYEPRMVERLERLQAYDPDNAAPVLLEASLLANSRISEQYQRNSPRAGEIQAMLESDPKWMALMNRAFAAPRFDRYLARHAQLIAGVWNREKYLSPAVVLVGLWGHPIPDLDGLRVFSAAKFRQAEAAAAAGDFGAAERLVDEVRRFGERLAGSNSGSRYANFENLAGLTLERDAARELGQLYRSAGRIADAEKAAAQMEQLDQRFSELNETLAANGFSRMVDFRGWGLLIQGLGIFLILVLAVVFAALLVLELAPARLTASRWWWRKAACSAADYLPAAVLVLTSAFLLSFLPYARVFLDYRSAAEPLSREHHLVEALWGLGAFPVRVLSSNYEVWFWLAVTVALSALAVFLVARGLYRWRRVPAISER